MKKMRVFAISDVCMPAKCRKMLNQATVQMLAESMLAKGLEMSILVRQDGDRVVLDEN